MNLRESIVSSSFYHAIILLLLAAASSYTTGFSGDLRNIISVDLSMEDKHLPETGVDSADGPVVKTSVPMTEESTMNGPPEESPETAGTDKKTESPASGPNAEQPSAHAGGFTSLEAYHQFIMMHRKLFAEKAGARVNELLGAALEENTRQFYGGTALVRLKFDRAGNLSEILVDSESPELKAFIEEIGWAAVPAPAEYSLGFSVVQLRFVVLEGYMRYMIDGLF